jgi:hypothetical protein
MVDKGRKVSSSSEEDIMLISTGERAAKIDAVKELRSDPTQPDPEEMTPAQLALTARYAAWMREVLRP